MPEKEPYRTKIATFNIGDFSGRGFEKGSEEAKAAHTATMGKADAELWALQEDVYWFGGVQGLSPYDAIYSAYPHYYREYTGEYNGKAFLSKYALEDVAPVAYPTVATSYAPEGTTAYGHPWFLTGSITLGDKKIAIVTLHFDWSCKERRAAQIDAVIKYAQAQEYCIITGDFNPENLINNQLQQDGDSIAPDSKNMYHLDWKKFSDAGFRHANGGEHGVLGTIMKNGEPASPYPWDNIVVTPNISILHAQAIYKPWMNDHAILVADLEIDE